VSITAHQVSLILFSFPVPQHVRNQQKTWSEDSTQRDKRGLAPCPPQLLSHYARVDALRSVTTRGPLEFEMRVGTDSETSTTITRVDISVKGESKDVEGMTSETLVLA
jgi:hypothetical protein